jgi:tetratricopeptide (TPR) repeat protein
VHPTAFENSRQAARLRQSGSFALSVAIAALGCLLPPATAHAARSCAEWSAQLAAVEGTVEVQRSGNRDWIVATSGERVCSGDTVRVRGFSRATVTLPDEGTLRLDENATLAFSEPESGLGLVIELLRGVIHVISRDPRSLRFTTPYANAGLEGTEFDIRVSDKERQTDVVVLEGEVVLSTPAGSIEVASGSIGSARAGQPPATTTVAQPIELMRWAAHYRPIIDQNLPDPDQTPSPQQLTDADFFARRAAAHLTTARLEGARKDLATSQRLAPKNPPALALEAMLALAHGDRAAARQLAAAAVEAPPQSAVALLALSHVQQSDAELAAAERSVRQALELEPDNALALTQLAELALAQGDVVASVAHATRAQILAPARSDPATVLGFAQLRGFDLEAARAAFTQAIAIEPAAPLPRLGLALTAIQEGDLLGGRQQLEIAVALDPADAITRSYMAKVYAAEHRDDLTISQLDLAMGFDPLDPTPWLYAALQKLRTNRPIEALQDLRAAMEKNGHRTVLRSRLGMDEDLATRSGGLGRLHTELGFGQLALVDAWHAVADEPADYANHRLLADVYATAPRHEIARVSELLLSQLLQPINVTPIKAQLAQPSQFVAERLGPSYASFNEFSPPVTTNGLQFQLASSSGGNGTVGEDISVAGLRDGMSYSVGQYRFATDGFRTNNDLDQRTANAFVQLRPSSATGFQSELRSTRTERGDLALMFDPLLYNSAVRVGESTDSIRFGARHDVTPKSTFLASVIYQEVDLGLTSGAVYAIDTERSGYGVDLQFLSAFRGARFQGGLSYARQDDLSETRLALPGVPVPITNVYDWDQRATSG